MSDEDFVAGSSGSEVAEEYDSQVESSTDTDDRDSDEDDEARKERKRVERENKLEKKQRKRKRGGTSEVCRKFPLVFSAQNKSCNSHSMPRYFFCQNRGGGSGNSDNIFDQLHTPRVCNVYGVKCRENPWNKTYRYV